MGDAANNREAHSGVKDLTTNQLRELGGLYEQLVKISAAAAEALAKAIAAPKGPAYRRFEQLDALVVEIADRIARVLS